MTLSMYQASVPVFQRMLRGESAILDKAAAYIAARKVDPAALLQSRLFPDMLPFAKQIQLSSDHSKGATARLAGIDAPRFEDTEATIDELKARIAKTLDFIGSVDPSAIDGSEDRDIKLRSSSGERVIKGQPYLLFTALPNFFFHVTTAYNILRHNGLEIGKHDYLAG